MIWTNAKSIWPACFGAWPAIHPGTILGCSSLSLPALHQNSHPNLGCSRPNLRVLCCEHAIQGTNHSADATINRWINKINHRLTLDRFIATKWNRKPGTSGSARSPTLPHPLVGCAQEHFSSDRSPAGFFDIVYYVELDLSVAT